MVVADDCSDFYGMAVWEEDIVPSLERSRAFSQILDNLSYILAVRAVKPWAVFRVTDAGVVELDTGDVIQ